MAIFSTALLTAIAIGSSVLGTTLQVTGAVGAQKAKQEQENLRRRQMELEANRRRRNIIREAIVAQSVALTNATSQGAQQGSGLAGAQFGITSTANRAIRETNENLSIGRGLFDASRREGRFETLGMFGRGVSNFGSTVVNNLGTFNRVGGSFGN